MNTAIKKFIPKAAGEKVKSAWQSIQQYYYSGNNYYCPFCKHSFRKMRAGGFDHAVNREMEITGAGRRENMLCPACYSTDRDRLIYLYLKYQSSLLEEKARVLHIAPSTALHGLLRSCKNIDYRIGTKYHEGFYYPGDIELLDIADLKYHADYFDVIICNHVLEHIPDDRKAMKEIYRVLKPGGWALLQVPVSTKLLKTYEDPSVIDPEERSRKFGQFDHVRIYGKDYPERLSRVGFVVEQKNPYINRWNVEDLDKYAINPKEVLFIAKKQAH